RKESDSEDELKEEGSREKDRRRQKSEYDDQDGVKRYNDKSKRDKEGHYRRTESESEDGLKETERREKNRHRQKYGYDDQNDFNRNHDKFKLDKYSSQAPRSIDADKNQEKDRPSSDHRDIAPRDNRRRGGTSKLSEDERAARLREMQEDAELHEEQRWKRLKKAEENDAREATISSTSTGRNFLDAAHKSIYGAEKGGSSTIEENVNVVSYHSSSQRTPVKQQGFSSCCTIDSALEQDNDYAYGLTRGLIHETISFSGIVLTVPLYPELM
ncbi:hypothetical protein V6N13_008869, partial [Hibiscus sabdariffa]